MSKQEVILVKIWKVVLNVPSTTAHTTACSFSLTIILTVSAFLNWQAYQS